MQRSAAHSVASDLGLLCLSMSHKQEARLIWVKMWTKFKIVICCKFYGGTLTFYTLPPP